MKSMVNRKEPEPQFVILGQAPGGNLIPAPQHCFLSTTHHGYSTKHVFSEGVINVPLPILAQSSCT
jgi:hypothetical protein